MAILCKTTLRLLYIFNSTYVMHIYTLCSMLNIYQIQSCKALPVSQAKIKASSNIIL